ncbi:MULTISPECIES: hypothetical protein [Rheinheimera]|uniref:hypothetical protein n=1 Tax=Rheinheimera TaxID=67575 RepID=UPI001049EDDF|nr:hypothetical protein [Rheinheimera sp. D18]QBL08664.1 hypothetical protein E0Z06_03620 [Rheinheimera sp. D18]
MTDPVTLLQQIAAQLQYEGKTPSLALFRARLAGRITPQQLFSAYQHWRANPVIATDVNIAVPQTEITPQTSSRELELTLARIEAKLDLLLSKLDN